MSETLAQDWHELNRRYLAARLANVRLAVAAYAGVEVEDDPDEREAVELADLAESMRGAGAAPPLDQVVEAFHLSDFERDLVLLGVGADIDGRFAPLCAAVGGGSGPAYPTVGLALAALPGSNWQAVNRAATLRRWALIELEPGESTTHARLKVADSVLQYVLGLGFAAVDPALEPLLAWVERPPQLTPSQQELALRLSEVAETSTPPVTLVLVGADPDGQAAIAAAAAAQLGLSLASVRATDLPASAAELDHLARVWTRDRTLGALALLIDCRDLELGEPRSMRQVQRLVERVQGLVFVSSSVRLPLHGRSLAVDIARPSPGEQEMLWTSALGDQAAGLGDVIDALVGQFDLDAAHIIAAAREAAQLERTSAPMGLAESLWARARFHARPRIDELARRIEPRARWDDLVLPQSSTAILHQIAGHVRARRRIYDTWGFAQRSARGLGISALFAGPSGTGKTMAAEVLANELRLDLYHIDLAATISKYIGETEKHLRQIFDAAEAGGAILLFDEADALFGKRTNVKDSHDRYANVEVSYLLQRVEAYRGLAILTSNREDALDQAFLRRLRFVVRFPFPNVEQRARIWDQVFPDAVPREGLVPEQLGQLNAAGGTIRNIALIAAGLAADEGTSVRPEHVIRAARTEYGKMKVPLWDAELHGLGGPGEGGL